MRHSGTDAASGHFLVRVNVRAMIKENKTTHEQAERKRWNTDGVWKGFGTILKRQWYDKECHLAKHTKDNARLRMLQ